MKAFKGFENAVAMFFVDPDSIVVYQNFPIPVTQIMTGDGDFRNHVFLVKFDRIAGQVGEQLPHLDFVRGHGREISHDNLCMRFSDFAFQMPCNFREDTL